jgi:hypothetical protein
MENKASTVVIAAIIFALVGTLVLASTAPYLSGEADASKKPHKPGKICNPNSPDGQDGPKNDAFNPGCGPND